MVSNQSLVAPANPSGFSRKPSLLEETGETLGDLQIFLQDAIVQSHLEFVTEHSQELLSLFCSRGLDVKIRIELKGESLD